MADPVPFDIARARKETRGCDQVLHLSSCGSSLPPAPVQDFLYDFLRDDKDVLEDWMWHADEAETSVALYLFPQFVDMSKAGKGGGEPLVDRKFIIAPGMRPRPGMMYRFEGTFARPEYKELENGIIGDATKATAEKGEKIVTRLTDHIAEIIEDIRKRYPAGEKPPVK